MALAVAAAGQEGPSIFRAAGVVLTVDRQPIGGAEVRLELAAAAAARTVRTDAAGAWRIAGLRSGRWEIRVEAAGFLPAEGFVDVGVGRPELEVRLRSLDEVSPRGAEGDPVTVRRWLRKGNVLLEQGRPAAARAEFERALPYLEASGRAQVLRAVARTHFLENAPELVVATLERALAAAPEDAETRRLLAAVLESQGRSQELEAIEERARRRVVAPAAPAAPPAPTRSLPEVPELAPEPGRAGRYRTSFTDPSPLSAIEVYRSRFGLTAKEVAAVDPAAGRYDPAAESWEIYVPEAEPPAGGYAVLVWISPTPWGGFTDEGMRRLFDATGVIWAGANGAGNRRHSWYRAALALDAAHHLARLYPVDPERVWVAGYSGGGRVASALAMLYPQAFRGGLFVYGANFYRPIPVPDRPGSHWPARFPPPPGDTVAELRRRARLVYLTGELDFNRAETRRTWEEAVADGFERAHYLLVPGASHYTRVPADWLARALALLEPPVEEE